MKKATRDKALSALRRAVRCDRSKSLHMDAYYELGLLLLTSNATDRRTYEDALRQLQASVSLAPSNARNRHAETQAREHVAKIHELARDEQAQRSAERARQAREAREEEGGDDDDDDE